MALETEPLLKIIEQKLDWGKSETWKSEDFENLHQLILQETGVSLSNSTLRRIWGKVEYGHLPSTTTLNTLARFGGYDSWRSFLKHQNASEIITTVKEEAPTKRPVRSISPWLKIISATIAVLAISLVTIFAFKKAPKQIKVADYSFSSKPVTRDIPNSVIFTYDASASPSDSIFIQQSWDSRLRAQVEKHAGTHTSVYYEPGFYRAKLIIDSQVVKEHALLVPTNGWLGLIDNKPVPVYLKSNEFISAAMIQLPVSAITKNNIPMGPRPPMVKYYNVGNFQPVGINNFSFSVAIKNDYADGAAACQLAYVLLVTDDNPIIISLSAKGCSSELNLMSVDQFISGKKADLSGFGVDFKSWAQIVCKSTANSLQYFVNDKLAYESPLPKRQVHIVGMGYGFQGTGSVKNIQLQSNGKDVFHAF